MKKNIFKYLIEFLIVAFGVFLGSYANERQNEKKSNRNKEKAIENIISELENNKEKLENTIEYHQSIKIYFDSIIPTIPEETYKELFIKNKGFEYYKYKAWKGKGFAEFEITAFETAKMSGTLQNMDIQLLQNISYIYNQIEIVSDFEKMISNRMTKVGYDTKILDVMMSIGVITGDNLLMEKRLIKKIEKSIINIKMNAQ